MIAIFISLQKPTAKAPPSIKIKFNDDLQDTVDRIPHHDILVMLGDFNARVGVLDTGYDLWQGVIGKHGLTECNFVGEEFLEFCALNQIRSVCLFVPSFRPNR